MTSLTRSALSGVAWNYAGIAVLVVAQVASTAATARLIAPAGFGAYAAAQAAIVLAGYFTISTIGLAVLRRSELGPNTVGSALVLSILAGVIVLVALWFAAAPWAGLWGIRSATGLVRVMAFGLFFTSIASVPLALVRRQLRFGAAALAETGTQVAGLALSVVLAVLMHSALALAIGQVVAGVMLFVWLAALSRADIRFGFDRAEGRELFFYGTQLSGLYLGYYAVNTLPGWVAGRTFGAPTLGLYSRANMIVSIPLNYLSSSVTKVLFPLYARVQHDLARTRTLLSEGIVLSTGFTWPVFAIIAGAAPVVVDVLLGPRWHGATPLLRLSALIVCGLFPTGLLTNAAEALGWIRFAALRQIVLLLLLGGAVVIVRLYDLSFVALLVGVAIAQWTTYAVMLRTFIRRGVIASRLVLWSHVVHGLVSVGAFALAFVCASLLEHAGAAAQVAGELVIFTLGSALVLSARSWYPASRILARRLSEAIPAGSPWLVRLRLESTR